VYGVKAGDFATLELSVPEEGEYELSVIFTKAKDYGIVQLSIDGKEVGEPFDGYSSSVATSDPVNMGTLELTAGEHTITFTITGKSESSTGYLAGIDVLRLHKSDLSLN